MEKQSTVRKWTAELRRILGITKKGFLVSFRTSWKFYLCFFGVNLLEILQSYVTLWFSALLVNELVGGRDLQMLFAYAAAIVLSQAVLSALRSYASARLDAETYFFATEEQQLFVEKIMRLDYADIESAEVQGLYRRVREASNAGNNHNLLRLRYDLPYLVVELLDIGIALWMLSGFIRQAAFPLWAWLLIVAVYAASTWLNLRGNGKMEKISQEYMKEIGGFCRARDALTEYLEDYASGKNLRLFDGNRLAIGNLAHWHHENDVAIDKRAKNWFYAWFPLVCVPSSVAEAFLQIFITVAALIGRITVGNIAKYISCIQRVTKAVSYVGATVVSIRYNADYLEEYFAFLERPGRMKMGGLPVEKRHDNEYVIRFDHVSFCYPQSEAYALKDINMTFRVGEKMAIVGQNGSGKTTFIKLLCRLYDPTEGAIYLNDIDIRKYDYEEYLQLFSVVFQDFKLFSFSLGENVAVSREYDRAWAGECVEKAGLEEFLLRQQAGLDTMLYREFDENGVEISGGEAQKVALARAICKNAPYVLLDEPTAALDPVAEFEIYSRFQEIVGDRTTVFISHRLSSCRFCRDIAVFHEGRLLQRGSHEELIREQGGKYYELWNAQAQYYRSTSA